MHVHVLRADAIRINGDSFVLSACVKISWRDQVECYNNFINSMFASFLTD